ncbi:hypothetical protein BwSH20_74340 [Bradyrhizobium ottawaense]|nr:hypothetical protein SG09_27270 [Bradyrhizobium ottawaense]GMO10606.1 hypothetical protein BwSH20_74340 [Bradyrhizobium ottawaense]GMO53081.1 hypothetical protein BwSH14_76220 [Bradyrhizobium ottawaense]GMO53421.1 hypothetical protein BwSF12_65080 [Bradyrhizobium ottawaense]GMO53771.1 hypothetical protein BwSF21_77710 [Bradyrhizobium ottawaense]
MSVETYATVRAFPGMAKQEQETKHLPACSACHKPMHFVDVVGSLDGPIAIFRCPECKKLFWDQPKRDQE